LAAAKEALRELVEALSDDQASVVLTLVRLMNLRPQDGKTQVESPGLRFPPFVGRPFTTVEAVNGDGPPASGLLIQDRR
jgi:hypothetical protein